MSVIFEGTDMPKACCAVDGEHSSFAHFEYCKFYNICKQRETIKTNFRPGDCPVKPMDKELITNNDLGVDCISRDSAIKALDYDIKSFEFKPGVSKHMDDIAKLLNTIYETQVNNMKALPSVTPQLSVPEITTLAEWTTKLTEASQAAYSQGYADGIKAKAESETEI